MIVATPTEIIEAMQRQEEVLRRADIGMATSLLAPLEGWQVFGAAGKPTLQNGWGAQGGWQAPAFLRTPDDLVYFRGGIVGTGVDEAAGTSVQVATLPPTYRPSATVYLNTGGGDATKNREVFCVVSVDISGNVRVSPRIMDFWATPGTRQDVQTGDTCQVLLDGLSYRAV